MPNNTPFLSVIGYTVRVTGGILVPSTHYHHSPIRAPKGSVDSAVGATVWPPRSDPRSPFVPERRRVKVLPSPEEKTDSTRRESRPTSSRLRPPRDLVNSRRERTPGRHTVRSVPSETSGGVCSLSCRPLTPVRSVREGTFPSIGFTP